MHRIFSSFIRIRLLLAICLLAGCETKPQINYSGLGLAQVTGTITLDGNPLEGATVLFEDAETGRISFGVTDNAGQYNLQFDSNKSGVMPGTKDIKISMRSFGDDSGPGDVPEGEEGEESEASAPSVKIPARYNRNTELTETIEADQSYTFDFNLTSNPDDAAEASVDAE